MQVYDTQYYATSNVAKAIEPQWGEITYQRTSIIVVHVLKIIHLMQDGSGKVAWLESNHFVGSSPTGGDIFF